VVSTVVLVWVSVGARTWRGKVLRLIQIRLATHSFVKNLLDPSRQIAASANRRFQFHKRSQLFIRADNKTFSVAAMRISNPDCSPVGINR
jgi:hypothetical protein